MTGKSSTLTNYLFVIFILSFLRFGEAFRLHVWTNALKSRPSTARSVTNTAPLALKMSSDKYDLVSKDGVHTISFEVAGKKMKFETGKIGRQAGAAVVASFEEETMVYSTVCSEREPTPVDFTPLRVDYFARYSAVGQTIGAFHRRDSRGDDNEILVARLIDRPLRPMIKDGWQHDTQVLAWVLSYDKKNSPEALAICAAATAMYISNVPMERPVAGVEVGFIDNVFVVNPTKDQMSNSTLKLTLAGSKTGILMIEGASDFLTEDQMMEALKLGHKAIGEICDAIEVFGSVAGKEKKTDTLRVLPDNLVNTMDELFGVRVTNALNTADKQKRGKAVGELEQEITKHFIQAPAMQDTPNLNPLPIEGENSIVREGILKQPQDKDPDSSVVKVADDSSETGEGLYEQEDEMSTDPFLAAAEEQIREDEASEISSLATRAPRVFTRAGQGQDPIDVKIAVKKLLVRKLRGLILDSGKRSDGRAVDEMRPIFSETGLLPGAHGSALFTRGETQTLSTATLGSKSMEARFETLDQLGSKRFYLQYRFPPSSVGEIGRVGGTNRREVGHGNLAERALTPCIPDMVEFPYSIRAESLVTESCGSSSMATVCGCCLAMLDAGVPLTTSVAGVAMGLILGETESEDPVILTDILGLEDALGTMDFKVAGNESGITTFQLDIKSDGLTLPVLEKALNQAKKGRLEVLEKMKQTLSTAKEMKNTVPRILGFEIAPESLGKVIGPKGKTVQSLIEKYGVININLQDDGSIQVESFSKEKNEEVKEAILKIAVEADKGSKKGKTEPDTPPPEPGIIYRDCEVKGIHNFGVFVEVLPGHEGLVHVSELDTKKLPSGEAAGFKVGDKMDIKCLGKNEKGQLRLSRRAVILRDSTPSIDGNNPEVDSNNNNSTPTNVNKNVKTAPKDPKLAKISNAAESAY